MSIIKTKLLVFVLLCASMLQGQAILNNVQHHKALGLLHEESVYIHHNTSLLLAGERLYYTIYCVDKSTNLKSDLSKIAYIELVGANGVSVFRHIITLNSGIGQGDFFVPASVPTGNYKLIGYTQWMKNQSIHDFFKSDINIVNPFKKNRNIVLEQPTTAKVDSVASNEIIKEEIRATSKFTGIKVLTDKSNYNKREKVQLKIENLIDKRGFGTYSISVRKKDAITSPDIIGFDEFLTKPKARANKQKPNDSIYLPELRGQILYGKVVSRANNSFVDNVKVALSILGKQQVIKIAKTDGEGMFYFNLDNTRDKRSALVQILGNQRYTNKIILGNSKPTSFSELTFNSLEFTPKMAQLLAERSIHNQIENAYLNFKQDTLETSFNQKQFYQNYDYVYNLEEYVKFSTIEELVFEVIDYVRIVKSKTGDKKLNIRGNNNISGIQLEPMILVDGFLLQKHQDIIDFDIRKIKKISLMRDKFIIGQTTYEGVIAFETFDGTFSSTYQNEYVVKSEMFNPLPQKRYFKQIYVHSLRKKEDKLPDFRRQLLWIPVYSFNQNSEPIVFYTSDVSGHFEIYLEGLTNEGKPVSLRANFTVN